MFRPHRAGFLIAALLSSGVTAGSAHAEPPPPTFLVLPIEAEGTLSDLGYALALRVQGILRAAGGSNVVHPKMLARVEERYEHRLEAEPAEDRRLMLGQILGADHVLHGQIDAAATRLTLTLESTLEVKRPVTRVFEGADLAAVLEALPAETLALVQARGLLPGVEPPPASRVAPETRDRQALLDYASCHRALIRQPLGIQNPIVVDEAAVRGAMEGCRSALGRDPGFTSAKADLALGHAFLGERAEAEKMLMATKDSPAFLPTYWLGKFWILSRYHDVGLALESLAESVAQDPGFMLGRGYLAEALIALGRADEALGVLQKYLERCPQQSYVMGELGYAYSKLGDLDSALAWTEKALRQNPGDPELLMQMASRLIDSKRYGDAISVLARVVGEGGARGEVYLRLGYACMMNGELPKAEQYIRTAITRAEGPSEWRTRGRARYNLAQLWLRSGSPENAIRQLRQALLEGYLDEAALAGPALSPLKSHPDFEKLLKTKPRAGVAPAYVSPLGKATSAAALEIEKAPAKKLDRRLIDRL